MDDQRDVFDAGGMRKAKAVNQAHIHERMVNIRAKIMADGGYADVFRDPAHTGNTGSHNADAAAKGSTSLRVADYPLAVRTYLCVVQADANTSVGETSPSPMAAGSHRTVRMVRNRLTTQLLSELVRSQRKRIFEHR